MAMGTDPIADLLALQRDVDRVMERFGARTQRAEGDGERRFWMPAVDVYKQGEDMIVKAEVPGVSPNDIGVSVTGNMLTIRGERRREQQTQEGDYVLQESRYGSFERRVTLPQDIDASQVRAQYRAGILEVVVPRAALISQQPRNVAVTGPQQAGMQQQGYQQQQQPYQQQGYQQQGYEQQGQGYQTEQPATESQPYGTGYGGSETQGREGYQQQTENPQVTVEGGWVRPEGQSQAPAEEEKPKSTLGSWLHGGD